MKAPFFEETESALVRQSPWFPSHYDDSHCSMRFFCFPFSGGSASTYRLWQQHLPEFCNLIGVELPGRAGRFLEPAHHRMNELIDELIPEILPLLDKPYAFFGHSNGALIAFELSCELARRGHPGPRQLILSAKNPPHIKKAESYYGLPRDKFIEKLRGYGGTPEAVWANDELMDMVLPTLRADFSIGETYQCHADMKLDLPVSVFAGREDPYVDVDTLNQWQRYVTPEVQISMFGGNHFYFKPDPGPLLRNITRLLSNTEWRQQGG